eukprot:1656409-Prymnesium_polylepis.1
MQGESVLIQQYCECLHWHNFVLFGPEQKAYYWEPLGKPLPGRSLIKTAFDAAAAEGPTVTRAATGRTTFAVACASESTQHLDPALPALHPSSSDHARTEPDLLLSYLCANRRRYAKAIDDDESMGLGVGSGVFPDFLRGNLINIRSTRGTARSDAERANNEFARQHRVTLRELLRAAARKK